MQELEFPSVGYPNWVNLAICMPLSGRPLPPEIMFAFKQLGPPMNTNSYHFHTKGWPVDKARNHLVKCARAAKAPFLFFWDEDVEVPAYALRQLMYWMEHHPEAAAIGGIYCLKVDGKPEPLVFRGNGRGPFWDWRVGEFFAVTGIGMGCTVLRTAVFDDLEEPWFLTNNHSDNSIDGNPYTTGWTEDLYFCAKVEATKKWKMYADGSIICPHWDCKTGKSYTLPPDSKPMRHLMAKPGDLKIVDIGCGEMKYKTPEGTVIGVDIRDECNPDFRADFRKLPFATGEFDIVYSSHTLEHCDRQTADDTLDEWVRILKPSGEMRLVLPNLEWAAEKIKAGTIDNDVLNVLYGAQGAPENFHKNGFTPDTIKAMLARRGFKRIEIKLDRYNIAVQAWRGNGKAKKKAKK